MQQALMLGIITFLYANDYFLTIACIFNYFKSMLHKNFCGNTVHFTLHLSVKYKITILRLWSYSLSPFTVSAKGIPTL